MVPLRPHRLDLYGFAGWLWRGDHRFGGEVERNAEDIGILHIEEPLFVQIVGLAAQGATDDLFAKKLSAECTDAENVSHGIRIPPLGQHGHGNNAADGGAKLAMFANRIHDLP